MRQFERRAREQGYIRIAGIDEAGRGPLAGPVVAGAVIFPHDFFSPAIRDSKQLSPGKREELYDIITRTALAWAIGIVHPDVIDAVRIVEATRLAMFNAVQGLGQHPDLLLIDGKFPVRFHPSVTERTIVKGDQTCLSIAAASILAKVTRDRVMVDLHQQYPEYGFDRHKGYGTRAHVEAIAKCGLSPVHRRSFRFGW